MPVVNPTTTTQPPSSALSPFAFLVSAFQWMGKNWLILGVILLVAFVLYVLYRMFIKQKEEDDIFLRDYKRTKQMCKLQSNRKRIRPSPIPLYIFGVSFFLGISMILIGILMNWGEFLIWAFGVFGTGLFISIFLHWTGLFHNRDRIYITSGKNSKWLGNYGGECVTEGWKNFLIFKGLGPKKQEFVVRCSLEKQIETEVQTLKQTEKGKESKIEKETITLPDEPFIEGEDSIIIKGAGLQQFKYFLYPIMQDIRGKPVSMKFVATTLEKEIALVDTLYLQTQDFSRIMREQVNINPQVRFHQKTRGDSSAVE